MTQTEMKSRALGLGLSAEQMYNALGVIVLTRSIRIQLAQTDPMALLQAIRAMRSFNSSDASVTAAIKHVLSLNILPALVTARLMEVL